MALWKATRPLHNLWTLNLTVAQPLSTLRREPPEDAAAIVLSVLADTGEHKQVEEMHCAQSDQDETELVTQHLNRSPRTCDRGIALQGQRDKSNIDQIEAHHQQMVHRCRQFGIAMESVHQEDGVSFVQRACHPNRRAQC